jgi:tetratricopeptide (TPR) repeat protein
MNASILVFAVLVLAGAVAHAEPKFTRRSEATPTVTLSARVKSPARRAAPSEPATALEVLEIEGLLGPIEAEKVAILRELIQKTPDADVDDKADYLFRLATIHARRHRYHRLETTRAEIALGKARDAALEKAVAEHRAAAKRALLDAIVAYRQLAEDPRYVATAVIDTALFHFGYTLHAAGYREQAREAYDKLLRNYPRSRFIPEAHLAFGDYHFEARQLTDAEARYRAVLKYPKSSLVRYAQYKLGWVAFNQRKFADAMQAFNDVAQATRRDPASAVLHRAARHDFVRAYAEVGKADKALLAFRRVGGGDGLDLLEILADLYGDQGKLERAVFVYRQLMTERPRSPAVCSWQHAVARAMLVVGRGDDKVREIEQLVKLHRAVRLPRAQQLECRDAASDMAGQLARAFHAEGHKTKDLQLLGYADRLYRAYLAGFPDAADVADTLYYHAELAWLRAERDADRQRATQRWDEAAEAFARALEHGTLSRQLRQVAAEAAMLARMKALHVDPQVRQEPIPDHAYDTVPAPRPLPAREAALLAAYDLYLTHVERDTDGERIDVLFHKANLLRRFDHHAAALATFEAIVTRHPDHETAAWSAQLALDSYNRLHQHDAMFGFADKLPRALLARHPELARRIRDLQRQRLRKQAEALEREAKRTGQLARYVECGATYLAAYNDDPLAADADVVFYNAGVCYEQGRSLGAAMEIYKQLRALFPKSPVSARAVARLGNVYASIAYYREAAEKLEEYAIRYGGQDDAYRVLSDAVQFRKGVGDDAKAIADTRLFIKQFGARRPAEAATAHFSLIAIYEKQGDLEQLARHLREYLDRHAASGGADRRVIASAKLGQALWQAACPVATVDGTCVRHTRQLAVQRRLQTRASTVPRRCGDETTGELVVVARDARKVQNAMAAFDAAIVAYEQLGRAKGDARGALYHYALARFGKAERDHERYLAMQLPSLDFRSKDVAERSRKRFEAWFAGKRQLAAALRAQYETIVGLKDGAFAIASAARLGAIFQNFAAQLYRAEIPESQRTGRYAEDTSQTYCDELARFAEPLQLEAEASYVACLRTSTRLGWFSEWSRTCERELGQLRPEAYPQAFELRASPENYAQILDVEPPVGPRISLAPGS